MPVLTAAMLIVVAIIHLLPLSGVVGPERLTRLYGLPFTEPNLIILMRHRAVLFGLLGVLLLAAAVRPGLQPLAMAAAWVSVVSFVWIAWAVGGANAEVGRVVLADLVAVACLVVATVSWALTPARA